MTPSALAAAILLAGVTAGPLAAQGPEEPVDRVVAVVGATAITYTQLQEEFYSRYTASGRTPPTDRAEVRREMRPLLDTLINDELIYQQALRDTTIQITPLEVSDAVDATMRRTRRQFPTEQSFLDELRRAGFLGIDDYRRWMVEQQGRELLKNRYVAKLRDDGTLGPVNPTEREVRAYYDAHENQIPTRPPTIWLKQIVVRPKPDSVEKADAFRRADSLARAIRAGADFAAIARRYSADAASAQLGGDLGWNRPGKFVREFDRVAFALAPGTVSNPVETVYGFHIIQVERVRPTEIKVRHILISPTIDSAGIAAADTLAHRVHDLVVGGASFDSLQAIYSDPSEEREARGMVIDSLPGDYQRALAGVDSGQVTPVFAIAIPDAPVPPKYAFIKVLQRVPAGPFPFDEIRENIRTALADAMGQEKYISELRKKTYIDIRDL